MKPIIQRGDGYTFGTAKTIKNIGAVIKYLEGHPLATIPEIARHMGMSERTAQKYVAHCKAVPTTEECIIAHLAEMYPQAPKERCAEPVDRDSDRALAPKRPTATARRVSIKRDSMVTALFGERKAA